MVENFIILTAVLALITYFLGAWIGCVLRRLLDPGKRVSTSDVQSVHAVPAPSHGTADATRPPPLEEPVAATSTRVPDRFSRALTGPNRQPPRTSAPEWPAQRPFEPVSSRLETIPERPTHTAPVDTAAQRPEPSPARLPGDTPPSPIPPALPDAQEPAEMVHETRPKNEMSARAAVAAATALLATADDEPSSPAPATAEAAEGTPEPDDFAALKGMDAEAEAALAAEGITTFIRLAALDAAGVKRLDRALGQPGRIARANWIEQAQMLASGRATLYVRQHAGRGDTAENEKHSGQSRAEEQEHPARSDGVGRVAGPSDDGAVHRRSDAQHASQPAAKIASVPVVAGNTPLGGSDTALPGEPDPQPEPKQAADPTEPKPPARPSPAVDAAAASRSGVRAADDLTLISGITPEIAIDLRRRGISRYAQIAALDRDTAAADRIESYWGLSGRIACEGWAEQARRLMADDGKSIPEAADDPGSEARDPRPPASLSPADTMERESGALDRQSSPMPASVPHQADAPQDRPDDLKRIRGVGILIEQKLRTLGVHTYDQVANWTRSDIDRVSEQLDFHGRIERENWVEQARILLSGGQTQFSRKFDHSDNARSSSDDRAR